MVNRLEELVMWYCCRMLKVSWIQYISNIGVLNRTSQEKGELFKMIKGRKLEYLVHIFRSNRYSILSLILNWKNRGIVRRNTHESGTFVSWLVCQLMNSCVQHSNEKYIVKLLWGTSEETNACLNIFDNTASFSILNIWNIKVISVFSSTASIKNFISRKYECVCRTYYLVNFV